MLWKETLHQLAVNAGISTPLVMRMTNLADLIEKYLQSINKPHLANTIAEMAVLSSDACEKASSESLAILKQRVASLSNPEILEFLRIITIFFHLVNSLEQHEIIRINRERALASDKQNPVPDSIFEALQYFKSTGRAYEEIAGIFKHLNIQPTITAHPTEARRRSILNKQDTISKMLDQLHSRVLTHTEYECTLLNIINELALLFSTDEIRPESMKVEDEVENGLFYFTNTIWKMLPRLYDEIEVAFEQTYGQRPQLPVVLSYSSWIGSDRDGNPNVTSAVTWETILEHRKTALQSYLTELREIRRYLSVSSNLTTISAELSESLKKDEAVFPLDERFLRRYQREPYRRKITHMMHRIEHQLRALELPYHSFIECTQSYSAEDFCRDLSLIDASLRKAGLSEVAEYGRFNDLRIRAKTFGFHLASLDIRQHSRLHEQTVAELLRLANVEANYSGLSEKEKIACLESELKNPRPLAPLNIELSETATTVTGVFHHIRRAHKVDPRAIGSYVISMTNGYSDFLEVLILAKEAGVWSYNNGNVDTRLDVVPLFETIDDLEMCPELMSGIFSRELYRKHLAARNDFQEVMLGYSDSNKDGGYWMANWALQKAQLKLGEVFRSNNIDFRLFHGRGGTVGRGGGRSNRAILGLPAISNNGRIRFTEQGEIISFRYSLPHITHRHLEQIVNAVVRVTAGEGNKSITDTDGATATMDFLSIESMNAYRKLIDDPQFWDWYTSITPVEHIGGLPIASRPVSRGSGKNLDFNGLRAIPWVFAWTQVRYNVPGWYGLGTALETLLQKEPDKQELLKRWYKEWGFFSTVIDNAQREMARIHTLTTQLYVESAKPDLHERIMEEYERTKKLLLLITRQNHLLDSRQVIRHSIRFRNNFTFPLNVMQAELLRRWNNRQSEDDPALKQALFVSINGIAAAMQSTG